MVSMDPMGSMDSVDSMPFVHRGIIEPTHFCYSAFS